MVRMKVVLKVTTILLEVMIYGLCIAAIIYFADVIFKGKL